MRDATELARRRVRPQGRRLRAIGLGFVVALLAGAHVATAIDHGEPGEIVDDAWAYDVWHDTMSPYCPGRTLAECPSPQADRLRLWILEQASAGVPRDEVQEAMFEKYGDQLLTAPRAEGWGLVAYVIPLMGFVLGGGIVVWVVRRLMGSEPQSLASAGPIDPEIRRRIDEESGV